MVSEAASGNPKVKSIPAKAIPLRRSAGQTLSYVDVLRQKLDSNEFQALLELCVRNPGARPALGQRERVEFNEAGHVTKLNLCGLPVSDLVALTALEDLSFLDLSMTPIADISVLAQCQKLTRLWLDQTQVKDLSPIADKMLVILMINQTKISNLDILRHLPVLEFLSVEASQVTSLDMVGTLPKIKQLNIRNTKVSDLSPLRLCQSLHTLLAAQCKIKSLATLGELKELVKIDLSWNQISDCNGLQSLPKLRELILAGNPLLPRSAGDAVHQLKKLHGDKIRIAL